MKNKKQIILEVVALTFAIAISAWNPTSPHYFGMAIFSTFPLTCVASPTTAYVGATVTWGATLHDVTDPSDVTYTWSGASLSGTGQLKTATYATPDTYTATVNTNYSDIGPRTATCDVTIILAPSPPPAPPAPPPTPPPAPTEEQTQQESQQVTQEEPALKPAVNMMTCRTGGDTLNTATEEFLYVRCGITQPGIVNAFVVTGEFDPKQPVNEDTIIKRFLTDEFQPAKPLVVTWDGINDYDSPVDPGDYTIVISAQPDKTYTPDYSILKFKVSNEVPPPSTQETTTEQSGTVTPPPAPAPAPSPAPLSPAAPEVEPPEPSKCPGINYPSDIKNHWAENYIKQAYDDCLLTGYHDGTFKPDQSITRAETVKVVLAATNVAPYVCYDNDCGSPYFDLDPWQGPWVRPAWDLKIIDKTGIHFEPNRSITRAEASAVVVRGFKFPIPAFCYTANCGAGFPDNFFIDIKESWEGPYIRSLWDKHLIQGMAPGYFEPDRPITRAELTKIVVGAREALKPPAPPTPPPVPPAAPTSTQESQQTMENL